MTNLSYNNDEWLEKIQQETIIYINHPCYGTNALYKILIKSYNTFFSLPNCLDKAIFTFWLLTTPEFKDYKQ